MKPKAGKKTSNQDIFILENVLVSRANMNLFISNGTDGHITSLNGLRKLKK